MKQRVRVLLTVHFRTMCKGFSSWLNSETHEMDGHLTKLYLGYTIDI
jgi:hypothetical protein